MRFHVENRSRLVFAEPVFEHQVELRLVPRPESYQVVEHFKIESDPPAPLSEYRDAYGNQVHSFTAVSAHQNLEIRFEAVVNNHLENPFDLISLSPAEEREKLNEFLRKNPRAWDFVLSHSPLVPPLAKWSLAQAWPVYHPSESLLVSLQRAMDWIGAQLRYETGSTQVHCPLETVLENRAGVCQDFSHLLIAIVRHWGFPARYVMGYQYVTDLQEPPSAGATHAWTDVYLPGVGWRGFDATHQLLANHTYLPVAVGRDSWDASPERGSYKGADPGRAPEVMLKVSQQ